MPYTGSDDPKLPAHVKAMAAARRTKWVKVFNSSFKNCRSPKIGAAGSVKTCEEAASKFANGAVKKKEVSMAQDEPGTSTPEAGPTAECGDCVEAGEKCSSCVEVPMMPSPPMFGGATSFDAVDEYREAQEFDSNIDNQKWTFDKIFENIMRQPPEDVTMEQKLTQVKSAVDEFAARSEHPPEQTKETGLVGKAVGAAKRLLGGDTDEVAEHIGYAEFGDGGSFVVTRDKETGALRWVAFVTNKFKDRDGEIFSEASHQEFTEWVNRTKQYSALRLVHVPGSEIGREDFTAYTDGFVISSGVFDEGMEDVAESLAASKEVLGISHGYHYMTKDLHDGVYSKYRRFEITITPATRAANPWTAIEFTGEAMRKEVLKVPLTDTQKEFLTKHLGKERTEAIEVKTEAWSKELEEDGIGFKELADIVAGTKAGEPADETPAGDEPADDDPADETPAATSEDEDDPGAGDPQGVAEMKELAPLAAFIGAAVASAIKPMQDQIAEITGEVKELSKSDDEKVADQMAPKTTVPAATQNRPTDDNGNVAGDKEKAGELVASLSGEKDDEEPASNKIAREYMEMMTGGNPLPQG